MRTERGCTLLAQPTDRLNKKLHLHSILQVAGQGNDGRCNLLRLRNAVHGILRVISTS